MEETSLFWRLLGWCRNPKTKLQKLSFHAKSSRMEEVILPLLLDIGIILSAPAWFLAWPNLLLLHNRVWILSYDDISAIFWMGTMLLLNAHIIYTYKHHQYMPGRIPGRFLNAAKFILFAGDTVAVIGLVGRVFRLPKSLIWFPGIFLTAWIGVLHWRFLSDEKDRARFYKELYDRSISIRTGRKARTIMREAYDKSILSRMCWEMKTKLGESHYH